jgi:hypothetical protein
MYYSLINSMNRAVVSSYTARTTAFASATAITDTTILNALNTFDLGLISNSLDTKMKAIYPFVGGTSATHQYNFFDPRDLDIAFRLQFYGGWTHSSNGIQGNGGTYADTMLIPSTSLSLNSTHASIYSRTNNTRQTFDIITPSVNLILGLNFGGTSYMRVNQITYGTYSPSSSLGLGIINRISSTTEKQFRNGSLVLTSGTTSSSLDTGTVRLGGQNGAGISWTDRQYSFASIGNGLTDGEASIFYTLVQNLQTSLSRNV